MAAKSYKQTAIRYAKDVVAGKIIAGNNVRECKRFLDDLEREKVTKVRTAMLTKYPENKEVRGIMKLVNRQKDKNNGFKLTYEAELTDRTEQETLEEWLRRERQWQKSRKQNMK